MTGQASDQAPLPASRLARVCMLHSNITRRNGEAASFCDLTLALLSAGIQVSVLARYCSGLEYRFGILRGRSSERSGIPPAIVSKSPLPVSKQQRGWRKTLGKCLDYLPVGGVDAGRKALARADVILAKNMMSRKALSELRKLSSAPIVLNHAGDLTHFERYRLHKFRGAVDPADDLYTAIMGRYDYILCQSTEIAREIREKKPGLAEKLLCLTPSVDWRVIESARFTKTPYAAGKSPIVSIGSIQARKNQLGLLEGMEGILRNNADVELHFLGKVMETEYQQACLNWVSSKGLGQQVRFHGHRDDALAYLKHADLLVTVSFAEGFPRVVREAMALDTPVASVALPGMLGILVPGRDFAEIHSPAAAEIEQAVAHVLSDPASARRRADSAAALLNSECSFESYSEQAKTLIERILDRPSLEHAT